MRRNAEILSHCACADHPAHQSLSSLSRQDAFRTYRILRQRHHHADDEAQSRGLYIPTHINIFFERFRPWPAPIKCVSNQTAVQLEYSPRFSSSFTHLSTFIHPHSLSPSLSFALRAASVPHTMSAVSRVDRALCKFSLLFFCCRPFVLAPGRASFMKACNIILISIPSANVG